MKRRIFKIEVFFDKNYMICPDIQLVANDYNSVEFYFTFDRENGRKVFELKKPDGTVWVKEVEDNKIVLADIDEEGNLVSLINQAEKYEFEVCLYDENSKLTAYATGKFKARSEVANVDNDTVSKASELPILTQLIGQVDNAIKNTNTSAETANMQAEYAKRVATDVEQKLNSGGLEGATYKPNVDSEGNLSWTNNKGLENPITQNIKGPQGRQGIQGIQGPQGDKPVKGVDYFTESDINLIISEITDNANSAFNQNVEDKTNAFDNHAAEKIEEYNQNTLAIENLIDSIVSKEEAEGQTIYITNALPYKLLNFEVEGNYKQKTTTGKNQFNAQKIIDKTNISIDDNDVVSISGISTSNGYCSTGSTLHELCPNLEVGDIAYLHLETDFEWANQPGRLKNLIYVGENWVSGNSKEITESLLNKEVVLYGGYNTTSTLRVMITKDSYDENFEPYTGGKASPNFSYKQQIKFIEDSFKIRKLNNNLLNIKDYAEKSVNGITATINNDKTIKISGTATAKATIHFLINKEMFSSTGNYCYYSNSKNSNVRLELRAKVDDVNKYLNSFNKANKISVNNNLELIDFYLVVEEGQIVDDVLWATLAKENVLDTYKQSKEEIIEVNFTGNYAKKLPKATSDKVFYNKNNKHIYLEKKIGKITLDGSENWEIKTFEDNKNYFQLSIELNNDKSDGSNVLSTHFIAKSSAEEEIEGIYLNDKITITTLESLNNSQTLEEFKAKLSNDNVDVYYPLSEEQVIDLGEYNLSTFAGENNISIISNLDFSKVNLEYALDIKKYTDDKLTEVTNTITNALISTSANI